MNIFIDNSGNNYSCAEQVITPSLACHALDNYWLRTTNMATFFAGYIAACNMTNTLNVPSLKSEISIYPNPVLNNFTLDLHQPISSAEIKILDVLGKTRVQFSHTKNDKCTIDISALRSGLYYIVIMMEGENILMPIVKE